MKIAMIGQPASKGGGGVHMLELSNKLRARGHIVKEIYVSSSQLAIPFYLAQLKKGFDIVHIQGIVTPAPLLAAIAAKKLFGCRSVCTIHSFAPPYWYRDALKRTIMQYLLGQCDRIISVSKYMDNQISHFMHVKKEKSVVIYNGVDTNIFNPLVDGRSVRQRYGIGKEKVILYVGRLVPVKGIDFLIKAIISLANDTILLIVGRGPLKESLLSLVEQLHLNQRVFFAGSVSSNDLPYYYAAADVCVVPSVYEPMGIVVLEAMSMKKPIVASNVGGIPELIDDGVSGLLVPSRNSESIAAAINRLVSDKEFAHVLAQKGLSEVKNNFGWEKITDHVCDLYSRLLDTNVNAGA